MARQSAKKRPANAIVRGSGNVFADLNLSDAEVRQTKLRLACALNTVVDAQRLTQDEAATRAEQGKAAAAAESDEMRRELARRIEGIAAAQREKEAGGAQ